MPSHMQYMVTEVRPALYRCRASLAHIRQSGPDSGICLSHFLMQKFLMLFKLSPFRSEAAMVFTVAFCQLLPVDNDHGLSIRGHEDHTHELNMYV